VLSPVSEEIGLKEGSEMKHNGKVGGYLDGTARGTIIVKTLHT
jgi:hypothetical protein